MTHARTHETTIKTIPASNLHASARNSRTTGGAKVDDLAASILATGLIQNLSVIPRKAGGYEVIAGGRRLRAIQQLIKRKALPKNYPVPCAIRNAEAATLVSTVENVQRESMHPADEFEAFRTMTDEGRSIEDVAAIFAVTATVVRQRLKLANVAPSIIALYRASKANMEQLMALAITDDHDEQERVWREARGDYNRQPSQLRAALTHSEIPASDRLARYVSIEVYEAAGGAVRRDLFEPEKVYLSDADLLRRLASEKLDKAAAKVRKEGWGWVEVHEQLDYSDLHRFGRTVDCYREATASEAAKIAALQAELDAIEAKYDELLGDEQSAGDDDDHDEATESAIATLDKQQSKLQAALQKINEKRRMNDDAIKPHAGAILHIDHSGRVTTERRLLKPEDKSKFKRESAGTALRVARDGRKPEVSDALCRKLTAQRTMALRAALSTRPDVALIAFVHALVGRTFHHSVATSIEAKVDEPSIRNFDETLPNSKAWLAYEARREQLAERLPKDRAALFTWLVAQPVDVLLEYLAFCVAGGVNAVQQRDGNATTQSQRSIAASHDLATLIGFDFADWWEVSADSYLNSVPKSKVIAAVGEACGAEKAAPLTKLPKAQAVVAAAAALTDTRWLPPSVRLPVPPAPEAG